MNSRLQHVATAAAPCTYSEFEANRTQYNDSERSTHRWKSFTVWPFSPTQKETACCDWNRRWDFSLMLQWHQLMSSTVRAKWLTEVGFAVAQQQDTANTYVCADQKQRQSGSTRILKNKQSILNDQVCLFVTGILTEVTGEPVWFCANSLLCCVWFW